MSKKLQEDMCRRLNVLINYKCDGNYSMMSRMCGITRQRMQNYVNGRSMPAEVIARIKLAYPDVSSTWLLIGDGPMIIVREENVKLSITQLEREVSHKPPVPEIIYDNKTTDV